MFSRACLPPGSALWPINITTPDQSSVHPFALVDKSVVDEGRLLGRNWRSKPRGQVAAVWSAGEPGCGLKKPTRATLASVVLGRKDPLFVAYRNGDRLDCRASNLQLFDSYEDFESPPARPGSSFDGAPEFAEALRNRAGSLEKLRAAFPSKERRLYNINEFTQREFLQALVDAENAGGGFLYGVGLKELAYQWEGAELPRLSRAYFYNLLLGKVRRLPGIDYAAIAHGFSRRAPRKKSGATAGT